MNKKWESPTLKSIGVEQTECGGWRYYYQCTNNTSTSSICTVYYGTYSFSNNYECSCGGIVQMIHKEWRDEYCNGICS